MSWQQEDGGKPEYLNSIVLFLLTAFNILKIILTEESLLELWLYWTPFFLLSIAFLIIRNKSFIAFFYLIIAIGVTITSPDASDFSGAIFFIFAFHLIRRPWALIVISSITALSIVVRSVTVGDSIPGNTTMLLVYFYTYGIYWFTVYTPLIIEGFPTLTSNENELLRLMSTGLSQKQAGGVLGCDQSQTSNMVKKIRKKVGAESLLEVMFCYGSINSNKK